jgi:iron-sulfur cluster assembly protein
MAIILTAKASSAVKETVAKEKQDGNIPNEAEIVLRLSVVGGGCSGFSYRLGFDDVANIKEDDSVTEIDGVKVVVDSKSKLYIDGTTIDYQDGLMGKGFTFSNPGETGRCGCGSSFSM